MSYCVAAAVSTGIVFASDSRTNAGVDHIAIFGKMHVFEAPGERALILLSAGNLASTQSVISLLRERAGTGAGREGVMAAKTMYEAAALVGATIREVITRDGQSLEQSHIDPGCSFILGGQIAGEPPRLFDIYSQGNFIEASRDTPYFQIGETKYGKPIIDRVVKYESPLTDVAKCLLVSFDSTMRSNLSVGLPIDLIAYERDKFAVTLRRRFVEGDAYFRDISAFWSAGLRRVFLEAPDLSWE